MTPKPKSDVDAPAREKCLQCGGSTRSRFCPDCGQRTSVGPLRARGILAEVSSSILDLELPILRTTKGLLTAPGRTAAKWVDGQRKTYTNPVKYCVIIGIVFTLLIRLQLTQGASVVPNPEGGATYSLSQFSQEYIAFLLMLLAIPFAPIAGLLSRVFKVQRRALDWYALMLYCLGASLVLQMAASFFSPEAAGYMGLLPVIFLLWGGWQFAGREARWRSLATATLSFGLWVTCATAIQAGLSLLFRSM